ncbi:MAG: DUF6650 family protein [Bacteroidota bacterium]
MKNRITGISCPFFGISWQPKESSRNVAKRILSKLEDRRVLYSPFELEIPTACIKSIREIRYLLTDELSQMDEDEELTNSIRALRSSCRKFLSKTEKLDIQSIPGTTISDWIFLSSLGELRGVFGIYIAKISLSYGIDIEENIVKIIPEEDKSM